MAPRVWATTPDLQETVSNMVQGVSQQAVQVRRPTQCEAQFDCLNHAVDGCTPRPGLDWMKRLSTADNTDAFFYTIKRTNQERYIIVVRKDGTLKAYNYLTGDECTISVLTTDATAYLASIPVGSVPWNTFAATSADDVTFIANKSVAPQMDSGATSPVRVPEALFNFRAGGYSVQYQIGIKYLGTWYNWSYTTPDNSVSGNAAYITPSAICYALYNAMVTDPTNPIVSHLGFAIERNANLIHLSRPDGVDFDITTDDGEANNFMVGLKDTINSFSDLPQGGYDGMVFKVKGDAASEADDYFVQFNSHSSAGDSIQGLWEETVAPNTVTDIDRATFPVALVNDDVNHFTLGLSGLGSRVAGDGINSAKDPSFIGRYIQDIFFDQRRLAIETDYSCTWSRTDNPYVFFPDTVQADLATAPIDNQIKASKRIAVLRHFLQTAAQTFLWAEGQQFLVGHVSNTVFSDQSIEVDKASEYEWNAEVPPLSIGSSVVFCYEVGNWSNFVDVQYQNGAVTGETGISDHSPKYVPKDVRYLAGSDTVKKLVIYSEQTPNRLYIYEYRLDSGNRVQSAWNTWRLPTDCHIVYAFCDQHTLYVLAQRPDGLHQFKCSLQPSQEDPEGGFLTCLDMRVTEASCTVSYDSGTDLTSITLPFEYSDDNLHIETSDGRSLFRVIVREDDADNELIRGQPLIIDSTSVVDSKTVLHIRGDYSAATFYAGMRRSAERTETTFSVHDSNQAYVYYPRLQLIDCILAHAKSGYFKAVLKLRNGRSFTKPYGGLEFGDPTSVFDKVVLGTGNLSIPINAEASDATLTFVSDDYLPCSWQGLIWTYDPTTRSQPGR